MRREKRWTRIYTVIKTFRGPAFVSDVYLELTKDHSLFSTLFRFPTLGGIYTDLHRMAIAGWLVEHEVTDGKLRNRFAYTIGCNGPLKKVSAKRSGIFQRLHLGPL